MLHSIDLLSMTFLLTFSLSKQKQQKRDASNVRKLSLRLLKLLHRLSKRNGGSVNGQLVRWTAKNLGRLRRRRRRDVKRRIFKRRTSHDVCPYVALAFFYFSNFLLEIQVVNIALSIIT